MPNRGDPVHNDRTLFEFLVLEGAQAGLSWETVLRKRERYRALFGNFDPTFVANVTPSRIERMLRDPGIIRNRTKIGAAVGNARGVCFYVKSSKRSTPTSGNSSAARRSSTLEAFRGSACFHGAV